jgi:hypothetical protein
MQRLGLRERLHEAVIDAWSKIVGEFIAAHSAPVALREGRSLRTRPPTGVALRTRANFQDRNPCEN